MPQRRQTPRSNRLETQPGDCVKQQAGAIAAADRFWARQGQQHALAKQLRVVSLPRLPNAACLLQKLSSLTQWINLIKAIMLRGCPLSATSTLGNGAANG